jgi:hypothetical protein
MYSCDVKRRLLVVIARGYVCARCDVAPQQPLLALHHHAAQRTGQLAVAELQARPRLHQQRQQPGLPSLDRLQQRTAAQVIGSVGVGARRQQQGDDSLHRAGQKSSDACTAQGGKETQRVMLALGFRQSKPKL